MSKKPKESNDRKLIYVDLWHPQNFHIFFVLISQNVFLNMLKWTFMCVFVFMNVCISELLLKEHLCFLIFINFSLWKEVNITKMT